MSQTVNKTLLAVTNRCRGFAATDFNIEAPEFTPDTSDAAAQKIREWLGLTILENDWHVLAALAALASFPDLQRRFNDHLLSYELSQVQPLPFFVSGGDLVHSTRTGAPAVIRRAAEWPAQTEIAITRIDAEFARIVIGKNTWTAAYRGAGTKDHYIVEWPAASGVSGLLYCPQWVAAGHTTRIHHSPGFVDRATLQVLLQHQLVQQRMVVSQFTDVFFESHKSSPLLSYAALLAEIGLTNKAVFP